MSRIPDHGPSCGHGSVGLEPQRTSTHSQPRAAALPFAVEPVDEVARRTRITRLKKLLEERIVLLDGAMGTMIQKHKLSESAFRGERLRGHGRDLKGNNDILCLTQPEVVSSIHR